MRGALVEAGVVPLPASYCCRVATEPAAAWEEVKLQHQGSRRVYAQVAEC